MAEFYRKERIDRGPFEVTWLIKYRLVGGGKEECPIAYLGSEGTANLLLSRLTKPTKHYAANRWYEAE